jgi:hypothetical protein
MLQNASSLANPSAAPVAGAYKVDISRGERIGRVSSEWFSRPDDERYLSLTALYDAVRARADRATARTVETRSLRVEASRDNAERLALTVPGRDAPVAPTNWSFGQNSKNRGQLGCHAFLGQAGLTSGNMFRGFPRPRPTAR